MVFGKTLTRNQFTTKQIKIALNGKTFECVSTTIKLGVIMDKRLRFTQHIYH